MAFFAYHSSEHHARTKSKWVHIFEGIMWFLANLVCEHTMYRTQFHLFTIKPLIIISRTWRIFRGFYLSVGLEVGYVYPVGSVRILLVHGGTPDIFQLGLIHSVIGTKNSHQRHNNWNALNMCTCLVLNLALSSKSFTCNFIIIVRIMKWIILNKITYHKNRWELTTSWTI